MLGIFGVPSCLTSTCACWSPLQPAQLLRHELGEEVEVPEASQLESFTDATTAAMIKAAAQRARSATQPAGSGGSYGSPTSALARLSMGVASPRAVPALSALAKGNLWASRQRSNKASAQSSGNVDTLTRVAHLMFRGLRLKAGVDAGPVSASVHAALARVTYRGRVSHSWGCGGTGLGMHISTWQQGPGGHALLYLCCACAGHEPCKPHCK
jgi:hypothetical protein